MMKKPDTSPCGHCRRPCNYTQCRDYRLWLNRCWNRYRRWPDLVRQTQEPARENVWRYDSPVLLHDFMEKGPCPKCPARLCCPDNAHCLAYEMWTELRWERIRRRLGGGATAWGRI